MTRIAPREPAEIAAALPDFPDAETLVRSFTKAELVDTCRVIGMTHTGTKDDLAMRLFAWGQRENRRKQTETKTRALWRAPLGDASLLDGGALRILQGMAGVDATLVIEAEDEWELAYIVRSLQDELDSMGSPITIPRPTRDTTYEVEL